MDRDAAELTNLRQEILERVRSLHGLITVATYLSVFLLVAAFFLITLLPVVTFNWYLLLVPLVFITLTFNYQANQMTMEAVGAYLRSKEEGGGWETFYERYKKRAQLTSFLKILPLLVPQLIPIVLWSLAVPLTDNQQVLASVDVALFFLVIANFRYKLF